MSSSSSAVTKLAGNFGRLWKRGHETFSSNQRKIISITGVGATNFLQNLVTCDLLSAPSPPREEDESSNEYEQKEENNDENTPFVEFSDRLRSACFLNDKGRIVTDSLLWKLDDTHYLIEVPTSDDGNDNTMLLEHLKSFKLRRTKVDIKDESDIMASHIIYGTQNVNGSPKSVLTGMDPRHPSLGMRVLSLDETTTNKLPTLLSKSFPNCRGTYNFVRKLVGVAEGSYELQNKIALEMNQDFLNAISFHKGCYLGQELTARVQHTGIIRKRILPILITDPYMEVPKPWIVASKLQQQQDSMMNDTSSEQDVDNLLSSLFSSSSSGLSFSKEEDKIELLSQLPRLPRLSAPAVGTLVGMMTGGDITSEDGTSSQQQQEADPKVFGEQLLKDIQTIQHGHSIIDSKDGTTIGQIISPPEPGTNVALAHVRLDKVGLLSASTKKDNNDGNRWSQLNKVTIGDKNDSTEKATRFRYLPYLPLWWPGFDITSGKRLEK